MDLQGYLDFLAEHPFSIVFWSSLIEAAGLPFPSRVILILTPALLTSDRDLGRLIIVAAAGALLGDHVPYLAGRLAGMRTLGFYCRVTLGSEACVEKTLRYFQRFGPAALLFSRFSATVRLFAAACAGCGNITYPRYLSLDAIGTIVYTTLCVLVGHLIGERAVVFLTTDRRRWVFLGGVVMAFAMLLGYRLWRRRRHGGARLTTVENDQGAALGTSGDPSLAGSVPGTRPDGSRGGGTWTPRGGLPRGRADSPTTRSRQRSRGAQRCLGLTDLRPARPSSCPMPANRRRSDAGPLNGSVHRGRHPAVDDEHLSGDRLRAAEREHLRRDITGISGPTQHGLLPGPLDDRVGKALRHPRALHEARRDAVSP